MNVSFKHANILLSNMVLGAENFTFIRSAHIVETMTCSCNEGSDRMMFFLPQYKCGKNTSTKSSSDRHQWELRKRNSAVRQNLIGCHGLTSTFSDPSKDFPLSRSYSLIIPQCMIIIILQNPSIKRLYSLPLPGTFSVGRDTPTHLLM